jgi:hypothetical protein
VTADEFSDKADRILALTAESLGDFAFGEQRGKGVQCRLGVEGKGVGHRCVSCWAEDAIVSAHRGLRMATDGTGRNA